MTQLTIEEYAVARLDAEPDPTGPGGRLSPGSGTRLSPGSGGGGGAGRPVAGLRPPRRQFDPAGGPTVVATGPDAGLAGRPGTTERPDRRPPHRGRVSAAQPRPWSVRQHGQPRRGAVVHRGRR
ncbi:hypothetical protein [Micromonospora echinaurantiaca]|uniref:hypothetical protein n=1 Tax=Micromonospora echinaurantiaca TaxID=47857 RepID=UPI000B5AEDC6|nr:hypothetical protein [Micromonospora echinaurantiaca]